MAWVVFLRAVNVGGSKSFKPSELPDRLDGLAATSIGAAGTFVVHGGDGAQDVQAAIQDALPFETEIMVRPGAELQALLAQDPFGEEGQGGDVKRYLTVLSRRPGAAVELPVDKPAEGPWQTRVVDLDGAYAFTVRRPEVPGRYYPNQVVEGLLGIPCTTRSWSTVERIGRSLGDG
ncbi:MAG: DUF1697 domain-containing protein [Candidatus Thermoplasmatota archaeon]|nr:DUF1697 domain-containing protein [Candidatus Thermoplasmatota archaeon]